MNDELFNALSNRHRRQLLNTLLEVDKGEIVCVPEAAEEPDGVPLEVISARLHHSHLPRLEELGLISWEQATHTVERGPMFEEIEPLLKLINENEDCLPDGWP